MNKYQKVIIQIVKDDMSKGFYENFRKLRNACREACKNRTFEDLLGFKRWNKRLPI
jgi:hypothetical protein